VLVGELVGMLVEGLVGGLIGGLVLNVGLAVADGRFGWRGRWSCANEPND
jgi:hypothetical protein